MTELMDDLIDVVFPSPTPPHEALCDTVSRVEFLARMDGTGAADHFKQAGQEVRVVGLLEVESLERWLKTRPLPTVEPKK